MIVHTCYVGPAGIASHVVSRFRQMMKTTDTTTDAAIRFSKRLEIAILNLDRPAVLIDDVVKWVAYAFGIPEYHAKVWIFDQITTYDNACEWPKGVKDD